MLRAPFTCTKDGRRQYGRAALRALREAARAPPWAWDPARYVARYAVVRWTPHVRPVPEGRGRRPLAVFHRMRVGSVRQMRPGEHTPVRNVCTEMARSRVSFRLTHPHVSRRNFPKMMLSPRPTPPRRVLGGLANSCQTLTNPFLLRWWRRWLGSLYTTCSSAEAPLCKRSALLSPATRAQWERQIRSGGCRCMRLAKAKQRWRW